MTAVPQPKTAKQPPRDAASQTQQLAATQALAAAFPHNAGKPAEFGRDNAVASVRGASSASSEVWAATSRSSSSRTR